MGETLKTDIGEKQEHGESGKSFKEVEDFVEVVVKNAAVSETAVQLLSGDVGDMEDRAMKTLTAVNTSEDEAKTFHKYDLDGDGMLSRDEIIALARGILDFEPSTEVLEQIFLRCAASELGVPLEHVAQLKIALEVARSENLAG